MGLWLVLRHYDGILFDFGLVGLYRCFVISLFVFMFAYVLCVLLPVMLRGLVLVVTLLFVNLVRISLVFGHF